MGLGSGLLFLPLLLLVFTTLPDHYRNQGSTMFALMRNVGAAVGVSLIQTMTLRDMATTQSRLVEHVRPDNPLVAMRMPEFDLSAPVTVAAAVGRISREAAMIAYGHTFTALFYGALLMIPLCLAMKVGRPGTTPTKPAGIVIE